MPSSRLEGKNQSNDPRGDPEKHLRSDGVRQMADLWTRWSETEQAKWTPFIVGVYSLAVIVVAAIVVRQPQPGSDDEPNLLM